MHAWPQFVLIIEVLEMTEEIIVGTDAIISTNTIARLGKEHYIRG